VTASRKLTTVLRISTASVLRSYECLCLLLGRPTDWANSLNEDENGGGGVSEYSELLKTRNLLIFRDGEVGLTHLLARLRPTNHHSSG